MFSYEFFETISNCSFIEHVRTATSILGKNLKNFTINYDLAKYRATLTIFIDFAENIWNSGLASGRYENPI